MLCVNTRYPLDPSGAKRLPDRSVTQTLEEAHASHCKTLPPQSTRAKTSSTNSPHTSGLCPVPQMDLWDAKDRSIILPHPWTPSFTSGLLLSGPPVASEHPQPCSFLCEHQKALTSLFLRCLKTTPDRTCARQHQPREDLSFAMWSTMVYHFHVPFSARSVNSSGLSLAVFFGILLILSAFVLKGSQASLRCPTSMAR